MNKCNSIDHIRVSGVAAPPTIRQLSQCAHARSHCTLRCAHAHGSSENFGNLREASRILQKLREHSGSFENLPEHSRTFEKVREDSRTFEKIREHSRIFANHSREFERIRENSGRFANASRMRRNPMCTCMKRKQQVIIRTQTDTEPRVDTW